MVKKHWVGSTVVCGSDKHRAEDYLTSLGNAVRMALNLGLNIDCSQWVASGLIGEDEAEVRKVTWWGCFTLDKYVISSLTCSHALKLTFQALFDGGGKIWLY